MRHRKIKSRLGRPTSHRKTTVASIVAQLIAHERVKTTAAKAKEAKKVAERLITASKNDTIHSRRLIFRIIKDRGVIETLFKELGPRFKDRSGGYTRILKLAARPGDGAPMALLELVEKRPPAPKEKAKEKVKEKVAKKKIKEKVEEKVPEVKPKAEEKLKPPKAEEVPKVEEAKPKKEEPKGFLGGLRKLLKRRKDKGDY